MLKIYDCGTETKCLTKLVKIIQANHQDKQMNLCVKNKWENEIPCNISPIDWEQMCKNIHETTNSNYWKEFAWKIIIRYFRTPLIQSKYKCNLTSSCWRKCGEQIAHHSHIFWSCKVLGSFWEDSITEVSNIFGIVLNKNPLILLLGKLPENIKNNDVHLFLIIRVALMKQITRNWLKDDNLSNSKWKDLVNEIYRMEKITMRIRNQVYIFEERWEKWVRYITNNMSNDL